MLSTLVTLKNRRSRLLRSQRLYYNLSRPKRGSIRLGGNFVRAGPPAVWTRAVAPGSRARLVGYRPRKYQTPLQATENRPAEPPTTRRNGMPEPHRFLRPCSNTRCSWYECRCMQTRKTTFGRVQDGCGDLSKLGRPLKIGRRTPQPRSATARAGPNYAPRRVCEPRRCMSPYSNQSS